MLSVVRVGSYGGAARRYQNEVEVGMIGVNVPIPYYSFGDWKSSLFGNTHAMALRRALLHRTQGRHESVAGPEHGGLNLRFPQND